MKKKKKKNKKGKVIENPLPEAMIHHIQSFMSAKEAARTTLVSKSWFAAWLTRPTIDLDVQDFRHRNLLFEEFVKKTAQRYQDSNLKIESLRVRNGTDSLGIENLIAMAMKFGATDVELEFSFLSKLSLPQEVFGSEILVRLSINWSRLEGNYFIRCSRLKSLTLKLVLFRCDDDHVFKDLTTSCVLLEELAVSSCDGLAITRANLNELHNLRRLILSRVDVDSMFFTDFASRFPCLNDLTILRCDGCTSIHIASISLETISYEPYSRTCSAKFDVPNIRKFTYSSCSLSSKVSINGALKEWDCDVSISSPYFPKKSWFLNLKKLFKNRFKRSRVVSLSIGILSQSRKSLNPEPDEDGLPKPFVVDNLRIIGTKSSCALLLHLLVICRPKFITLCLHSYNYKRDSYWSYISRKVENQRICEKEAIDSLCEKLMQQVIPPNCGIPNQNLFRKFGLKRVNMEVMDKFGKEWRPLVLEKPLDAATTTPVVNKRKVRFQLIWD